MYQESSRFLTLALAAAVLGAGALQANAQESTFHLPFKAHWGLAVLEPGDYKLSTSLGVSGTHMIQLDGPGNERVIVPAVIQVQPPDGHSSLELIKINGAYVVTKYKLADTGQVFYFVPSNSARETAKAASLRRVDPDVDAAGAR